MSLRAAATGKDQNELIRTASIQGIFRNCEFQLSVRSEMLNTQLELREEKRVHVVEHWAKQFI
jgi:hypothetical protein